MKVYRVETKEGYGPYQGMPWGWLSVNDNIHPVPSQDSKLTNDAIDKEINYCYGGYRYKFGFISEEQFLTWFYNDDYLTKLEKNGFRITIYEVPKNEVAIGNSQVVFKTENAKQYGWKPLENYITTKTAA